mmetsp:Transcript_43189/g.104572  ORF Transcript_43189/g.104572 Transcript_43189/m.104572 type:complete len:215 (+) Transcript_43189:2174-2818(+)
MAMDDCCCKVTAFFFQESRTFDLLGAGTGVGAGPLLRSGVTVWANPLFATAASSFFSSNFSSKSNFCEGGGGGVFILLFLLVTNDLLIETSRFFHISITLDRLADPPLAAPVAVARKPSGEELEDDDEEETVAAALYGVDGDDEGDDQWPFLVASSTTSSAMTMFIALIRSWIDMGAVDAAMVVVCCAVGWKWSRQDRFSALLSHHNDGMRWER